ncbi:oxygen-independent coproporphyrinogen-3 oxidase [Pseudovibrio ascidiaceicola]|uniref:Oxygen-independent coproporphyrinogen-3 oxidase n=1 Tax=Pseudovibrio ascidiaceicola TaxID=285279 RepID=A0A1I3VW25_9HYPH|nr:heme anaerobic degradation radical SAM methyltransferase ChuW/HutW [Pseudovibrio ascidiaceicola]SFJ99360.1 oxygen-independent coproporphyrinogen-3 oxidase [Pseudovibrio ascidiaceicola]
MKAALEQFFAQETDDPLRYAFQRRGAHMPGSAGEAVLEEEHQLVWQEIQQSKRSGMAVMYLHVPFCANHCLFCGFYRNKWHEEHSAPYADALIKELELEASSKASQSSPINAVYFGGGTPTALHAKDLARVIRRIRELYPLSADCEITVEGRIFHFDDDKIDACLDAGANRFSTGVQSFNTKVRKRQGRKASGSEAIRFFEGLRDRNRAAIVCDLILGLPYQTEEVWRDDLRTVVDLGLDGVDLYTLAVFPGSTLSKAIDKGACDPAAPLPQQGAMYGEGLEYMHRQGWKQISSSHWGRQTRERNLYNTLIKSGADCLAFGSGAGGNINGYSYGIHGGIVDYMRCLEEGEKPLSRLHRTDPLSSPLNFLAAGIEEMRLDLGRLERIEPGAGGFRNSINPLLSNWQRTGLIAGEEIISLTTAGRFWHQTLLTYLKAAFKLHSASLQPETKTYQEEAA